MEKHRGHIVEYWVRKNGYSITDLARETGVNRRSIYNWFKTNDLRADIILKIGNVIRHDFSNEFPQFFTPEDFKPVLLKTRTTVHTMNTSFSNSDEFWKDKYLNLLERISLIEIGKLS